MFYVPVVVDIIVFYLINFINNNLVVLPNIKYELLTFRHFEKCSQNFKFRSNI